MPGTLYLVATPIGNLQDITPRAIETLKAVDVVACEDTRHTGKLLKALDIKLQKPDREGGRNAQGEIEAGYPIRNDERYALANARAFALVSYHEHNEAERAGELGKLLEAGKSVAVVSDAGTPGINDPGYRLVQKAIEVGADVVPIPGAVAFVNAVVASGLPTDSIFFGGFLPSKTGERKRRLEQVKDIPATLVFYESPHRIAKSIADCLHVLGGRRAAVARELTKIHEEIVRGDLFSLNEHFSSAILRGEYVLVIAGEWETGEVRQTADLTERVRELEAGGMDRKTALKTAAKERGIGKSEAYRILQSER